MNKLRELEEQDQLKLDRVKTMCLLTNQYCTKDTCVINNCTAKKQAPSNIKS